jgi:hypothetical protein
MSKVKTIKPKSKRKSTKPKERKSTKPKERKSTKPKERKSKRKSKRKVKSNKIIKNSVYDNVDDIELATSKLKSMMKVTKRSNINKIASSLNREAKMIAKNRKVNVRSVQDNLINNINNLCKIN